MDKSNRRRTIEVALKESSGIILSILLGIAIDIGYDNLPADQRGVDPATLSEGELDPCPNGAAYWLFVAGISHLVTTLIYILVRDALAEGCGKIDCVEKIVILVNFAITIWGSVVVFGAWSTWTYDYIEYKEDMDEKNYCMYQPMITAIVLLLFKWVLWAMCWCAWLCGTSIV